MGLGETEAPAGPPPAQSRLLGPSAVFIAGGGRRPGGVRITC